MIKLDGYDEAIIGPAMIWVASRRVEVLVYNAEIIGALLMERDGMELYEARNFIEANIKDIYLGVGTPVIVWPNDEWSE